MEWRRLKMSKENEMHSSLRMSLFSALLASVTLSLLSCTESATNNCENGHVCPSDRRCVRDEKKCLPVGSYCGDGNLDDQEYSYTIEDGGLKTIKEECDDGNATSGDGCSADCKEEYCGNGGEPETYTITNDDGSKKEVREVCDHGLGKNSEVGSDDCSRDCLSNLKCGNGTKEGAEVCDHGIQDYEKYPELLAQLNTKKEELLSAETEEEKKQIESAITSVQTLIDTLLNTQIPFNPQDPENNCSPNCSSHVECNDGVLDDYGYLGDQKEKCDFKDGRKLFDERRIELKKWNLETGSAVEIETGSEEYYDYLLDELKGAKCIEDCREIEFCGDGVQTGDEECDPGSIGGLNAVCTDECKIAFCGDGKVNAMAGEECDHGKGAIIGETDEERENSRDSIQKAIGIESECTAICKKNTCGDGIIGKSLNETSGDLIQEECDEGPMGGKDCTINCTISFPGDGIVNQYAGEECDPKAAGWDEKTCTKDGKINVCGDGEIGIHEDGFEEECDPKAAGWDEKTCTSQCKKNKCGDGETGIHHEDGFEEECDLGSFGDGSIRQGPTCDSDCTTPECGDGIVNESAGEQCDTGDKEKDTKECNGATCYISKCGDDYINKEAGEECDSEVDKSTPSMVVALQEYCSLLSKDAEEDVGPFKDSKYSFCVKDEATNSWVPNVYMSGKTPEEIIQRRAAAEYHYYVEVLKRKSLDGVCVEGKDFYADGETCKKSTCGNGRIDIGEVCDTGKYAELKNLDALTGETLPNDLTCSDDCLSTQICGNGIKDENESCDPPIEGCIQCLGGEKCGNGVINEGEPCDEVSLTTKGNIGYCVITRSEIVNDTWTWFRYVAEKEGIYSKEECDLDDDVNVWNELDSKCFETNCIRQGIHEKCLPRKIESCDSGSTNNLLDCYDERAVDPIILEEGGASCEEGYDLVEVCIFNSCDLASCGDSYIFDGVEQCDHAQGKQTNQESLEESLESSVPCVGQCKDSCRDVCNHAEKEAECIACKMTFVQVYDDKGNPIYDDEGKPKYCNYNCKANECGDGIQNELAGEACDWGESNNATECPNGAVSCTICTDKCQLTTIGCGNGIIDSTFGENCDYKAEGYAGNDATFCDTYDAGYPCKVCENNCKDDKEYNKIEVQIKGDGTVISNDERINCFSSGKEDDGALSANDSGSCSIYYTNNTNNSDGIVFSAIPSLGWQIDKIEDNDDSVWSFSGNCTPSGEQLICKFPEERGQSATGIRVTFKPQVYMVSLSADEGGCLINLSEGCTPTSSEDDCIRAATCSGTHTAEISVTAALRPETQNEYTFVKWEKGCSTDSESGSSTCTNVIGSGWSNRAIFEKLYKVTHEVKLVDENDEPVVMTQEDLIAKVGYVSSTVASDTSVISGTEITLLAVPRKNEYEFSRWELSNEYACSDKSNPCKVTIDKKDLDAVAVFKETSPKITVQARYIDGINADEQESPMSQDVISFSYSQQGGTESETIGSDETFSVVYGQSYTISYEWNDGANDGNVYRIASWMGCVPNEDNSSCTIPNVEQTNYVVKLIFYKSKFNLNFAFKGLLVDEALEFTCTGSETAGTDCRSLFNHKETVTVALDTTNSVCTSDKHFSLSIGTSGELLSYSCDCAAATEENDFRRYTNCRTASEDGTEATESSSDPTSFSVMMDSDKTVNVVVTKDEAFLLSSAEDGTLVDQMHGSVLGKVGNPAQVAYYCQPGNCTSAFIEKGSDVELTATPATGYELTAWRVQVNGAVNYYDSPADDYTIDLEQGTFSFAMQAPMDVTPVFMPTLTVTASPADSATFTCTLSGCSDASNTTACVLSPISDGSLYNGYPQSIECAQSEGSCEIPACAGAFSSEAVIDIEVTDHSSGYHSAGWSISDEERVCSSTDACKIENIDAPLSVTVNSEAKTGNISWNYQNASVEEQSQISYQKAELRCRWRNNGEESLANCSNGANNYVRYTTVKIGSENWSNGYYVISVPVLNDRGAKLTCPGQLYRCIDSNDAGKSIDTNSYNYNNGNYDQRVNDALNELKSMFTISSMGYSCSSGQNVECLYQYDENNKTISVEYGDIEKNLRVDCGEMEQDANVEIAVTWNTLSGSHQAKLKCDDEKEVAQNAALQFELTSIDEGYEIAEWQFGDETGCSNHPTCTGWTMPTSNEDIRPVVHRTNVALTLQSFPKTEAPDRGTFSCSTYDAETNTWGDYSGCESTYPYDTHISVKATPVGNNEFLKLMNGSGCPSSNGWTEAGVCENIVMTEDQIVSAVFSTKPVVSFNSNQEGDCKISCPGNENECVGNSRYVSSTEENIVFSAPKECVGSSSREYELLKDNNLWTCPATSNQWNVSEESGENAICTLPSVTSAMTYVYAVYTEKPTLTLSAVCEEGNTECAEISCTGPEDCATGNQYSTTTPITATAKLSDGTNDYEFLDVNNSSTCPGGNWNITTVEGTSSGKEATCEWNLSSSAYLAEARFTKKPTLTLYASAGGSFVDCDGNTTVVDGETLEPTGSQHTICAQANDGYVFSEDFSICPGKWSLEDGIAKCENVTMNGNQTVIASFVHDGQMSVSFKTINGGTWACASPVANVDCSAEDLRYSSETCQSALSQGATLCVKALASEGFEFDEESSICPGTDEEWSGNICSITNDGSVSNETVLAVFKAMPTVTLVPTTGGTFINCETGLEISDANLMPTAYPSMSEVQVCVMPSEGYELQGDAGCPGTTGWTAVEEVANEGLAGAYKCAITSLNANQVVYANFSVVPTSPVVLTKIGNGTLSCAVINAPDATCPTEETSYTETACQQNQIAEDETLCIKASGSEGSDSQPATEFNPANSRCAEEEWPTNGVCPVSYKENGEAKSVVADFVEQYALTINSPNNYDTTKLVTVAKSTCASAESSENAFESSSNSGETYAAGSLLCIKAMMHDETNYSSLELSGDNDCLWIPKTGKTEGAYYLCDVEMTGGDKEITLRTTSWPTLTFANGISVYKGSCDAVSGEAVTPEVSGTQILPGSPLCASVSAMSGDATLVSEEGCPEDQWVIAGENATCDFIMTQETITVSASYKSPEEEDEIDGGTTGSDEDAGDNLEEDKDGGEVIEDGGTTGSDEDAGDNLEEDKDGGEVIEDGGTTGSDEDAGDILEEDKDGGEVIEDGGTTGSDQELSNP